MKTLEPQEKDQDMGRVLTEVKVENVVELFMAQQGLMPDNQVRRLTVPDALVDTGATSFALPSSLIQQLGLPKVSEKRTTTGSGLATFAIYGPVRITIQERFMTVDVMEVPDGNPALVGQIPLEALGFVIDPQGRRLIANPAHGGEHILEM